MDVLIKNIEMPKDCYDCPFIRENKEKNGFYDCIVIGKACALGAVHKDCPLIELPPHGRLIDADELLASDAIDWGEDAWNGINHAPVVLEAST